MVNTLLIKYLSSLTFTLLKLCIDKLDNKIKMKQLSIKTLIVVYSPQKSSYLKT